jgi:hypothetical protein
MKPCGRIGHRKAGRLNASEHVESECVSAVGCGSQPPGLRPLGLRFAEPDEGALGRGRLRGTYRFFRTFGSSRHGVSPQAVRKRGTDADGVARAPPAEDWSVARATPRRVPTTHSGRDSDGTNQAEPRPSRGARRASDSRFRGLRGACRATRVSTERATADGSGLSRRRLFARRCGRGLSPGSERERQGLR